jgi:hypothetical protein
MEILETSFYTHECLKFLHGFSKKSRHYLDENKTFVIRKLNNNYRAIFEQIQRNNLALTFLE